MTDLIFDDLAAVKDWFNAIIRIGVVKITIWEEWKQGKIEIHVRMD